MFRRAGNCTRCELAQGDDNRSKGFGSVQFETPFEALTAIAMFNGVEMGRSRRKISVRLVSWNHECFFSIIVNV